jgi:peptide/nickel transport system substrate-binding protein
MPLSRSHARSARAVVVASLATLTACGSRETTSNAPSDGTGGTVIITVAGDPNTLFPPMAASTQAQAVVRVLYDRLAEIGPSLNTIGDAGFTPRLATSWSWSADSMRLTFRLDARARWHDGQPVHARDVQYGFRVETDPAVASVQTPFLENIDSVSVADSLTVVVWFKRRKPSQFFDVAYNLDVLPAHRFDSIPMTRLARTS